MSSIEFTCLPTIIGSMPHTDPSKACSLVTHYLKEIPAWPQLPRRSFRENMCAQFSQGFPGIVIEDNKIYIDRSQDIDTHLEKLYAAYLDNDIDKYAISPEYAAGLHEFLSLKHLVPRAVKGQITGPVTWGLTVADDSRRPVIYDDILGDALTRLLRLKASWQEKQLSQICRNTIIFVDEPYLSQIIYQSAQKAGATVHMGGTMVVIEGPAFSTRAESFLYRSWGTDVIGMTALPEAKLAREAEICYASIACVSDYDCWHEAHESVTVEIIMDILHKNADTARNIIKRAVTRIPETRNCECTSALKAAIVTDPEMMPAEQKKKLSLLIDKYLT